MRILDIQNNYFGYPEKLLWISEKWINVNLACHRTDNAVSELSQFDNVIVGGPESLLFVCVLLPYC